VHIVALHEVGSNNPDGIEIKDHKNNDGIQIDGVLASGLFRAVQDQLGDSHGGNR
jgi:quinol-cytochrome oxidoreductase complex cytochrome b subunit